MLLKLRSVNLNLSLDRRFERIVNRGFFKKEDCYFLKIIGKIKGSLAKDLFEDDIAIEHSINEIYIKVMEKPPPPRSDLKFYGFKKQEAMSQTLILISKLLEKWRNEFDPLVLVATLGESEDDFPGCVVGDSSIRLGFYVKRSGLIPWLADNLEGYEENAVLEVDSQDDILYEIKKIQSANIAER